MKNNYTNRVEMDSEPYKLWRNSVFARDRFICQKCNIPHKKIEAHHIIKWSQDESKRFLVSNGLTLCLDCHKIVTGREIEFENEFQRIIAQKRGKPKFNNTKPYVKPKYIKKSPWNRYGG